MNDHHYLPIRRIKQTRIFVERMHASANSSISYIFLNIVYKFEKDE